MILAWVLVMTAITLLASVNSIIASIAISAECRALSAAYHL